MNHTSESGRPSRNSQGIHSAALQPTISTTPVPETPINTATDPHTTVKAPLTRCTPSQKQFCSYEHLKYHHTNTLVNSHTGQTISGRSNDTMN